MADIEIHRNHSMDESELRHHLRNLAEEMARKFGIKSEFRENMVYLFGKPLKHGEVAWTSDALSIKLTFDLMGKMFKSPIKSEIEKRIESIVTS